MKLRAGSLAKIRGDSLMEFWSSGNFNLRGSGNPQNSSAPSGETMRKTLNVSWRKNMLEVVYRHAKFGGSQTSHSRSSIARAALSIWWALRTLPCRGPNPSVDRRVRWMRRAPGWQGAPDGQQAKKLVVTKCLFYSKINI